MSKNEQPRIAKISTQLQVRIPRDLYAQYGFGTHAQVVATPTGVEFRPVKTEAEQCGDILKDLVERGLEGDELLAEFRKRADSLSESCEYHSIPTE